MRKRSEPQNQAVQEKLLGLGERSFQKNIYPELQVRLEHLERFRSLLDHTRDIILLASLPSARIVDVNISACRQLGYVPEVLKDLTLEEILELDSLQWPEEGCLGEEGVLRSALRRADGSMMSVEFTLCVDRFGPLYYLVLVARDITEALHQQELLRQSEERFRSVFISAGFGMAIISPEGRFIQVNPAMCRFLGYSEEELSRLDVVDVTHPEDRERTLALYREVLQGERQSFEYEKRYLRRDGGIVWGHAIITWLYDPDKKPIHCVAQVQDITERKKAEDILRESDRMKTEFISTAAHELRTPLTSIQGFSELLLAGKERLSEEERSEFIRYIHETSINLSSLVDDLLDIARIESGQGLTLNRRICSAGDMVGQCSPLVQKESEHRFFIELCDEKALVEVDLGKMRQVLENLLSNAVKYSPAGTPIRIEGKARGNQYELAVSDQGRGMTPEEVSRIFEKFYRVDTSNTAVSGIGLGMSIVRSIVEAHGGRIWVESEPGQGTTVRFTVPLRRRG